MAPTGTGPACADAIADPPVPSPASPTVELGPAPAGPWRVGTRIFHFVDGARPEVATDDPDDHREVVIQLFYPTDADGPAAGLMADADGAALYTPDGSWPAVREDVRTHSTFDVPLSGGRARWPLLLYSHGLGGPRHDNRDLLESLASQGVVVAAVSHTFYDWSTTLTSGAITRLEALARTTQDERNRIWDDDLRFVIGELERPRPSGCGRGGQGRILSIWHSSAVWQTESHPSMPHG